MWFKAKFVYQGKKNIKAIEILRFSKSTYIQINMYTIDRPLKIYLIQF